MKHSAQLLLITFLLVTTHNTMHAYRWIMNNFSSKTLLVQIELLHSTNPYFVLVEPRHSADFDWSPGNVMAGFCLGKIKYVVVDNNLLNQSDLINKQTMEVRDNKKLLEWLDSSRIQRKEADLKIVTDELFKATVDQAKKAMGTKIGAKIVGYFADVVAKSGCRGRDILIVEKNGALEFYTLEN